MSDVDGVFDGIAAANPDLNGGEPVLTLRIGEVVVSLPEAEFERLWRAVADALLGDGVYVHAWVPVSVHPPLVQLVVAQVAYKWAVLAAFEMGVDGAERVFASVLNFLGFVENVKEANNG